MFQSDLISVSDDFIIQYWTVIFLFLKSLVAITFSPTNRYEIELTLNLMICFYFSKNSQYWSIFSSMLLLLYWKYFLTKNILLLLLLNKKKRLKVQDYLLITPKWWWLFFLKFSHMTTFYTIFQFSCRVQSYLYAFSNLVFLYFCSLLKLKYSVNGNTILAL